MSWGQPPYNPAYSQAQAPAPGGVYQQHPYNPAYGQPPPAGHLPPSSSVPPGGQMYQQPPPSVQAQPPVGVTSELWGWFQSVDADCSGKISATELRQALVNSNWTHFNPETCRLLIGMFDQNKDGAIDVYEFSALWKYIQEWRQCFDTFDKDKSGNIDASELQQALSSFGYRLSMQFCSLCTRVFDRGDRRTMKFDDFIQCCVMLRSLTEGFKKLDTNRTGTVTINYEQFLEMAIDNTM